MAKVKKETCDYTILFNTFLLVSIGLIMVYSSSYYHAHINFSDAHYFFKRQLLWSGVGITGMLVMMNFDYWKLRKFTKVILFISFVMLSAVAVMGLLEGPQAYGATRWLRFKGIGIQPSEVAKFAIILYLANILTVRKNEIGSFFKGVVPSLMISGLLFILIVIQPDLSTAGSLSMIVLILLYVAGAKLAHLFALCGVGVFGVAGLVAMEGYRMARYTAFLNPWADPRDTGYQIIQSLYALGHGGLFGTGLTQGRQSLLYLPEPFTDAIFSIIGEELGFIGTGTVMILFMILIWRGIKIAINAPDLYGCLLATGVIGLIGVQVLLNVAVATSSIPPTGLPLPFISYGGSSLAINLTSIGVLLNISKFARLERG